MNRQNGVIIVNATIGRREDFRWEKHTEEMIPLADEQTVNKTGKVKYALGMTINLGNYESLRVDVGVELPTSPETFEQDFEDAKAKVANRLYAEVNEAKRHA